jgi:outer membrane protein W
MNWRSWRRQRQTVSRHTPAAAAASVVLDAGTDLVLAPRTTLSLDLRYLPVAETVVLDTPRGDLFRKGIDTHPLTLTLGIAYRVFTPRTYPGP